MNYLSQMTDEQVLVMYSGHPLGLFPTRTEFSPRLVITNGLVGWIELENEYFLIIQVIPNYSSINDYERMFALGCTM